MKKLRPVEQRDNTIGWALVDIHKHEAKQTLETAKLTETLKKKQGFIWVAKGTVKKQIHPNNLETHLKNNWRILQTNL